MEIHFLHNYICFSKRDENKSWKKAPSFDKTTQLLWLLQDSGPDWLKLWNSEIISKVKCICKLVDQISSLFFPGVWSERRKMQDKQ